MHFWCHLFPALALLPLLQPHSANSSSDAIVLDCFYCRHSNRERDVIDRLDQHPECLSFELFNNQSQFKRTCTKMEPFCTTIVNSLNGFFADVRRDCTERCRPGCEESGYGIFARKCTRCCQSSLCNYFDGQKFLLNELDVQQLAGGRLARGNQSQTHQQAMEGMPLLDSAGGLAKGMGRQIAILPLLVFVLEWF